MNCSNDTLGIMTDGILVGFVIGLLGWGCYALFFVATSGG